MHFNELYRHRLREQVFSVQPWTSRTVDDILLKGNGKYRTALANGHISDAESLSVYDN